MILNGVTLIQDDTPPKQLEYRSRFYFFRACRV